MQIEKVVLNSLTKFTVIVAKQSSVVQIITEPCTELWYATLGLLVVQQQDSAHVP